MVCNLTVGKKKYEDVWDDMSQASKEISGSRIRLLELVDEDTNAFNDVMKAFRMPKETDEEKAERSKAIQIGYKKAIETPLETAQVCLRVLEAALPVAEKGNKNSISDAGVGADMAASGLEGALINIRVNPGSIKDEDYVKEMEARIAEMTLKKEELLAKVKRTVDENL
jgi:formiminotetrahydrofolate cyclodeaminase